MMVMWSSHDGINDTSGRAVTDYMTAAEVEKADPETGEVTVERRDPRPEVLAGDAETMRRAIKAVDFERKYCSAVLSFHRDDVDVAAFNEGDPDARRRIAECIRDFEDTAFAGIDPADRPPTFWTTHTHTGRLELNFVTPRAILVGDKLRSINVNPPGQENRATWDAFRDVQNVKNGWADPEDPTRQRLVAVPDHVAKAQALRERMGQERGRDGREVIADWVAQRIEAGAINNRADVLAQLREQGFQISREGKDYVSVTYPGTGDKFRLKGPIFAATFVSRAALGDAVRSGTAADRGSVADQLAEAEHRLGGHRQRRADFHRGRYQEAIDRARAADQHHRVPGEEGPGKPGRAVDAGPAADRNRPQGDLANRLDGGRGDPGRGPDGGGRGDVVRDNARQRDNRVEAGQGPDRSRVGDTADTANDRGRQAGPVGADRRPGHHHADDAARTLGQGAVTGHSRFKARLWESMYQNALPADLVGAIRYVDTTTRRVNLVDGSRITDHGDKITASTASEAAIRLMVAEGKAKGWESQTFTGSDEFKAAAAREAVRQGVAVANPELQHIVREAMAAQTAAQAAAQAVPPTPAPAGILDPSPFSSYRPMAPQGPQPPKAASMENPSHDRDGAPLAGNRDQDGGRGRRARAAADVADRGLDGACQRLEQERRAVATRLRDLGREVERGVEAMSRNRANELEDFKAQADLREVAAWLGFQEDRKASDRNHTVMRDPSGRKLVVGINADTGHWCYSDNQGGHGTAIDLVQQVKGGTLGEVRRHLRPFIGAPERRPEIDRAAYEPKPKPRPTKGKALQAKAEWETANVTGRSVFLEKSRGLAAITLADPRFAGTFRVDERQNAVFPYWHGGDIVAVERRNRPPQGSDKSFKGYTAGAVPGVWVSQAKPDDRRLVVVESPIDAMSFHQMHGDGKTRYVALRQGYDAKDLEGSSQKTENKAR